MKTDDFKSIENQFFISIHPSNPFKSGFNYLTRNRFCTLYKQGNWVFHGTDKVVKYRKNWGFDGVLGKNLRGGYSDMPPRRYGITPSWDSATMGFRHHGLSPMASYIAPLGLIRGSGLYLGKFFSVSLLFFCFSLT
jgi:hypothetical protein